MSKRVSIVLVIVAVALLWVAGAQNGPLVRMRDAYHLDSTEALHNAPPMVAFTTVVLGGFRGILTDILWLRASYLQDQGKYLELLQLADWITKLEPRCADIWTFHAWNMAYNVSVMMSRPEDRWRWVHNGIQLLRDEGLLYNPGDPELYQELGWTFQYKMAGDSDEAHLYYQREWAREMDDLLGGGQPDYAHLAADTQAATRLRTEYKLDPEIMKQVDAAYGPLDWRLPNTHALYWAWRGKKVASAKTSLPCDRMIYQGMAATFMTGRLRFSATNDVYETAPYPEILPSVLNAFDYAMAKHPDESIRDAYVNFLQNAIYVLHVVKKEDEARWTYDQLRAKFAGKEIPAYETLISTPSAPSLRYLKDATPSSP